MSDSVPVPVHTTFPRPSPSSSFLQLKLMNVSIFSVEASRCDLARRPEREGVEGLPQQLLRRGGRRENTVGVIGAGGGRGELEVNKAGLSVGWGLYTTFRR